MPISITAAPDRSIQIRKLHAQGLSADDICDVTGFEASEVAAALGIVAPRPRIEAIGPLSAEEVASITGMPLSSARLLVR
jgi:hypothetical protein